MSIKDLRQYVIEVEWDEDARPKLPPHIGPFDSREDAEQWGSHNIPNGVWRVWQMAYPYVRSNRRTS